MLSALDLFAERGYEDTTVIEIAHETWSDTATGDEFRNVSRRTLGELGAASALC